MSFQDRFAVSVVVENILRTREAVGIFYLGIHASDMVAAPNNISGSIWLMLELILSSAFTKEKRLPAQGSAEHIST